MTLCGDCKNNISRDGSKSIQCSACLTLFHVNKKCSNTTTEDYKCLNSQNKLKDWKCSACIQGRRQSMVNFIPGQSLNEMSDLNTNATKSLSAADIQAIIKVVKKMIHSEFSPTFKTDFYELKEKVDAFDFENLQKNLINVETRVDAAENVIEVLSKENDNLKKEIVSLQNYSRKENIIITGVPETKNEIVRDIFNCLSDVIKNGATGKDLSAIHRIPARGKSNTKPIVVKFISRITKDQWLTDFWNYSKNDTSGAGISTTAISRHYDEGRVLAHQHLAPAVVDLLRKTKKVAEGKGYKIVRVRDSKIVVKRDVNSKPIIISEASDLDNL